jgi:hypothetical protein
MHRPRVSTFFSKKGALQALNYPQNRFLFNFRYTTSSYVTRSLLIHEKIIQKVFPRIIENCIGNKPRVPNLFSYGFGEKIIQNPCPCGHILAPSILYSFFIISFLHSEATSYCVAVTRTGWRLEVFFYTNHC